MGSQIIDLEDALDRVQDDKELLFELFDIFENDFKVKRKELDKSLAQQDIESLRNLSHSLKGAAGNISAMCIHEICFFLEKEASENRFDSFPEKLKELDEAFAQYQKESRRIRDDNQLL